MFLRYIIIFLIVTAILYLISIKPNKKRNINFLLGRFYAHRGIHDNNAENPENSLLAFKKAIDMNYGIELDVHVTQDNIPVVFHDETLLRVCGIGKDISSFKLKELEGIKLFNSKEPIPSLKEVLELVDGKVPLIVEIKNETMNVEKVKYIASLLDTYNGLYVIESFNPLVLLWYKKNRPQVIRGQLSTKINSKTSSLFIIIRNFILMNLLMNFITKPDFIAFDYKYKNNTSFKLCKKLYNPLTIGFTITSQKALQKNFHYFDLFIFDSFIPIKDTKEI